MAKLSTALLTTALLGLAAQAQAGAIIVPPPSFQR